MVARFFFLNTFTRIHIHTPYTNGNIHKKKKHSLG